MTQQFVEVVISPDGTARHLVDATSESIAGKIGPKIATARASHVESFNDLSTQARAWLQAAGFCVDCCGARSINPNDFWADLLPVGGPVLGPFSEYAAAIDAEVAWLQEHNLPDAAAD